MGVLYKCVICSEESTHTRIVNGKRYCIGCENLYDNFYTEIKSEIITPEIKGLIETGIYTDGGHHKQWCLERLAELFGIKLDEHEEGIAP